MKKIVAFMFLLIIGLMVLGGCSSTTNDPSGNQNTQQNTNLQPQQNTNQNTAGSIPQPPALPED